MILFSTFFLKPENRRGATAGGGGGGGAKGDGVLIVVHGRSLEMIDPRVYSHPYDAGAERVGFSSQADIACTKREAP